MKKWLRALVAVVLVLVLVVNVSPIRAEALLPTTFWDTMAFDTAHVITSGAMGLGTRPGSIPDDWNVMIENAEQAWYDFCGVAADATKQVATIFSFFDGSTYKYYASADFLEWLQNYLFTALIDNTPVLSTESWGYADLIGYGACDLATAKQIASRCKNAFIGTRQNYTYILATESSGGITITADKVTFDGSIINYAYYVDSDVLSTGGKFNRAGNSQVLSVTNWTALAYDPLVTTSLDLELGHISALALGDGYPDWVVNSATIPAGTIAGVDEDTTVYPIGLGQTVEETLGLTQEQIWAGESTYVDTSTDTEVVPETVTLTEIWTAVTSIPANIAGFFADTIAAVQAIPAAIAEFFTPSGDVDSFGIQLKDFFPFCIPYDLYDFLTCLAADPVAPVFHWEIPVPQLGQTFELEVDLTAWDDVAQLFRNLELLAFIVGLAYVTREKFLRS